MATARRTLVALIGMALIGTSLSGTAVPATAATGPIDCATDTVAADLHLTNVTVDSATPVTSGTFTPTGQPTITGLPVFCDVDLTHTDPAGNPISVEVWLPQDWNGRFQGVGGSGFFCGIIFNALTPTAPGLATGVRAGYATASTDCGHPFPDASFALNPDDTLNRPLITDYATAGVHDMTVDGKALTVAFYGRGAVLVLLRLFHRRPPGHGGGAAIPVGLQRHRGRCAGDQLHHDGARGALAGAGDERQW